ncbi:hypothetical protein R1flu_024113 [Riccia fluitans]|uniref:Uncharacterized protein n=1 Tax=Riccia fluitans TaxID=41844 RepID=A0ABD1XWW3_9MARC
MMDGWYRSNPQVDPPRVVDFSDPFAGLKIPQTPKEETDITNCEVKEEVKKLREERENRRLTFLEDVESKRIQLDERRIAMEECRIDLEDVRAADDAERAKELVGA